MNLPKEVNILGVKYIIEYVDNPAEVDIHKRESLWGQADFWTRSIRIYKGEREAEDVWQTILHEIFHVIIEELHLMPFSNGNDRKEKEEDLVSLLAMAFNDVLFRNKWIVLDKPKIH